MIKSKVMKENFVSYWKQHEIWRDIPLLDKHGRLTEEGWAKSQFSIFNRKDVKSPAFRIKQSDMFFIANGKFGVTVALAKHGYSGYGGLAFYNYQERAEVARSARRTYFSNSIKLSTSSKIGNSEFKKDDYTINFTNNGKERTIDFNIQNFYKGKTAVGHFTIFDEPRESLVMYMPFDNPKQFCFNQKINCMQTEGYLKIGNEEYKFNKDETLSTLSWCRGVWTIKNDWFWATASGFHKKALLGWNLGKGFGDDIAASENCIFFNNGIHKLEQVSFDPEIDKNGKKTDNWVFSSNNKRFEMTFEPLLKQTIPYDFVYAANALFSMYGKFSGKLILDSGFELEVEDYYGIVETNKEINF